MAFVPGYDYDIFISYAHGDDRAWVDRFADRLVTRLRRALGATVIPFLDKIDVRPSRDFNEQIPAALESSAVFLMLTSPLYLGSRYCGLEADTAKRTAAAKQARFDVDPLRRDWFAIRCPILPVEGNEHHDVIPGLTDIEFCDTRETFAIDSAAFNDALIRLRDEIARLLRRMRNHATPVFLYPCQPPGSLRSTYDVLAAELTDNGYRVLPERYVNLDEQLQDSALAVFLAGEVEDTSIVRLAKLASRSSERAWVVWTAPAVQDAGPVAAGAAAVLEQLSGGKKSFLNDSYTIDRLKAEIMTLLKPRTPVRRAARNRPLVYLVYNRSHRRETINAGIIQVHYGERFEFHMPDDVARHTERLRTADGVLLVWGDADERWCSQEFKELVQNVHRLDAGALCLFDPREGNKAHAVTLIRTQYDSVFINEQFGPQFDKATLEPFFDNVRRHATNRP